MCVCVCEHVCWCVRLTPKFKNTSHMVTTIVISMHRYCLNMFTKYYPFGILHFALFLSFYFSKGLCPTHFRHNKEGLVVQNDLRGSNINHLTDERICV